MKKCDMIVIGFGKGGKTIASKYASLNKKVALIEKSSDMYGGTCINVGCIPTKTLLTSIDKNLNYQAKKRRDQVVSKLRTKNFNMFNDNPNIDVITASAKFVSDKVVEIVLDNQKELLTADIIVINTGSKPNILPIKRLEWK